MTTPRDRLGRLSVTSFDLPYLVLFERQPIAASDKAHVAKSYAAYAGAFFPPSLAPTVVRRDEWLAATGGAR